MIVLGITGYARAGKDTVADYLVANHGFTKLSFASPIKEMLRKLDPMMGTDGGDLVSLVGLFDMGYTEDGLKESRWYGPEYRRLMQVLGTDCVRAIDEDFWVNAARKLLTDPDGRYVFSDVRMPNEADMIWTWPMKDRKKRRPTFDESRRVGLWQVERDGTGPGVGCHVTEMYVGGLGESYTVINNSSLEELHEAIETGLRYSFPEVFSGTS